MYLGLRILSGSLWTGAFVLLLAGSLADLTDTRTMFFTWGLFLGMTGGVLTIWLAIEHVVQRESARNVQATASAVGEAVGQAMSNDGDVTNIR